ncbi:MAG: SDR family oxidoreductase [Ruminococcaceae bacterium]|nr:SDR family oxidoreductase [Oscillospiraceae bacterium]
MMLKNKNVIITGAAGGIGLAAARRFASEGAFIIGLDVNAAACEKACEELKQNGFESLFLPCDISSEESVNKAFDVIEAHVDHIDGLYNNASVFLDGRDGPLDTIEPAIWHKIIAINLTGMYYCTRRALPLLKIKGGAIVNTSSSAGVTGIPECAAYTASKGAMVTLTRSLAVDYGKYNIRTNCIAPAAILTEMVKASNLNNPAFNNEKFLEMVTPIRRWGTPEDIAAIACWLFSDDASYLNGAIIRADGGITANGDVNR